MAKYGWKDGEGLGKEKDGVRTYIKVVRRDPKAATGLGHVAEAGGSMGVPSGELDEVYRTLRRSSTTATPGERDLKKESREKPNFLEEKNLAGCKHERSPTSSRSSSISWNSSSSEEDYSSEKPLTDEELFKKCGGVRLGRAGRHRCFQGKLERVSQVK